MNVAWYCLLDGVKNGPIETAEMLDMAHSGKLRRSDLVWKEGLVEWQLAGSIPEIFPAIGPPPIPTKLNRDLAITSPVVSNTQRTAVPTLPIRATGLFFEDRFMRGMTNEQRASFLLEYFPERKSPRTAFWLTFFWGMFGVHNFYRGRPVGGVLMFLFFWTGIPGCIAFIEWFTIGGSVRRQNEELASRISGQIR